MSNINEEIPNKTIAGMMEQYEKIINMMKIDCKNKGIAFIGYGYFRESDSIKDNAYDYITHTTIYPYDKFYASKSFTEYLEI